MTNKTNTENLECRVNSISYNGKFIISKEEGCYIFDAIDFPEDYPKTKLEHLDVVEKYGRTKIFGGGTIGIAGTRIDLGESSAYFGRVPIDIIKKFGIPLKDRYEKELGVSVTCVCYFDNSNPRAGKFHDLFGKSGDVK